MASATPVMPGSVQPRDDGRVVTDVIRWYVETDETFQNPLDVPGLPALRTEHPIVVGRGCLLDSYSPTRISGLGWYVDLNYSTDGRFRLPDRVDDDAIDFTAWDISYSPETIDVPQARLTSKATTNSAGQPIVFGEWVVETYAVPVVVTRVSRRINLSSFGPSQRRAIAREVGKVHVLDAADGFDGRFRFLGGSTSQIDAKTWAVRYEWEQRGRVPAQTTNLNGYAVADLDGDPLTPLDVVTTIRRVFYPLPPLWEYIVIPGENPSDPPFLTVTFAIELGNPSNLPGDPLG